MSEEKNSNVEQATEEVAHEEKSSSAKATADKPAAEENADASTALKEEAKETKTTAKEETASAEASEDKKAEGEKEEKATDKAPAEEKASTKEKEEAPKAEEAPADSAESSAKATDSEKDSESEKATASKEKEEEPKEAKSTKKATPKKEAKVAPEDFDWDSLTDKGFGEDYSDSERAELEKLYENTVNQIEEKQVISGTVVGITAKDVILNIGYKSDGLVSKSEFKDQDLKVGDEVHVYLETQEDKNGQIVLSRRKANIVNAWENIKSASENDTVIEGFVKRRTKGGLIVDIYGVESFLPGSQIDVKPIRDFDVFVGKNMEVKVVKINYSNDNVVVSHKVLIEKDIEEQKTEILNNLEKGQVLEGVVKNMTNFGVFIDLGGVDGLLHITDISWGRINHPEEVLNLDQSVQVVVLDFDDEKKRISLGMKQLTDHPWDSLPTDIAEGSKVKGKIVNVADYGAFLEIMPGVEGLIHVSEMSWSQHLRNPSDFIKVGDEVEAVVLSLEREERKMSLGIKQMTDDPWTKPEILEKYAVGTKHTGTVRNMTHYGLFLELEEGIDGLVHVSDLSWTKKIKHPSEFVKVGDELEVVVMELDVESRRLALSHKHIEENPWDAFEDVFKVGSSHKGTIIELNEKGARVELQYGIEGSVSLKALAKEDGSKSQPGDVMDLIVTEFNKEERRIQLSHTRTWRASEQGAPEEKKKTQKRKSSKAVRKVNLEVERTTLGELEALSALKEQMEDSAKAAAKKAAPKAKAEPKEEAVEEATAAEEAPKAAKKPAAKKAPAKAKKESASAEASADGEAAEEASDEKASE